MNVLVLGGGVIGITTAWYLTRAGHAVTVFDRQHEPARETSHANGGQISWSAGAPWAAPGIPWKALKWMLRPHSPLVLRPRLDPAMWAWLFRMLGNCTESRFLRNKERMFRLARYSHEALAQLRADTGIIYDEQARGTLVLLRSERQLAEAGNETRHLSQFGIPYRMLDRAACVALEPALAPQAARIAGGIHYTADEIGDCRAFTLELAARAQQAGARFEGGTVIERLEMDDAHISGVVTNKGRFKADSYVLACGSYSPLLVRPLGLRVPVYPVKGYSLTLPIDDPAGAPQGTVTDETYKVVLTRLGNRLRAAGTAELTGYDLRQPPARLATIAHVIRELFPRAGDLARAEPWTGLRPMTPDNPPLLGPTPFKNLLLNTGHGTLGWTMACGSARVLADLVSGRAPEIDLDGLTLARFD